jgi:sortase A
MSADVTIFTAPRAHGRTAHPIARLAERLLLFVALSALGYYAGTVGGAAFYQDYESRQLDAILRAEQTKPPHEWGPVAAQPGRVVGRIEIPSLGVSTIIKDGEDAATLRLAVGHIAGTAMPGGAGNVGLAGHRDTFFRRLRDVKAGDRIRLVTTDGVFTYVVDRTRVVEPDDVSVLDATPEPALTLVTCYPFTYIGPAPQRFIVHARLADAEQPDIPLEPTLRPAAVNLGAAVSGAGGVDARRHHRELLPVGRQRPRGSLHRVPVAGRDPLDRARAHPPQRHAR